MADRLEFLTRVGCHLCEDALAALRRLGVDVDVVDIDLDPGLLEEFDHRVPVVRDGGSGACWPRGRSTTPWRGGWPGGDSRLRGGVA